MYPTVSFFLKDVFGIDLPLPIQTFGLFVAVSFLLGAYYFSKELKRKEEEGFLKPTISKVLKGAKASANELISSSLIGFLLGYKLGDAFFNYSEFASNPQQFILSLSGNWIIGLFSGALAGWMKYNEKEKEKLPQPKWVNEQLRPHEHIGSITITAALFGLMGAKVFHLLENPSEISGMFDSAGSFFSGLTMYGGLITGGAAVLIYSYKKGFNLFHVMDASAPGLMLAYGFGRLGCQFSGDGDWGIDNLLPNPGFLPDWAWAYRYPHNVIHEGVIIPGCEGEFCTMLENPVFPTPLYEAVICITLFVVLWSMRKSIKIPGVLFGIYLMMNGVERFFIEKIRINSVYHLFGNEITQAEIISTCLFLVGLAGVIFLVKKQKGRSTSV